MRTDTYPYKWLALIGLSLLSFTAFLDFTIVTTALPFIQKDLHASVLQLQWVMSIFSLILCMFMIIAGKTGDILGRKKVFFWGFVLFGTAAIGAANSPSIEWLIFFRSMQGLGAAIIFTVGVALLPQAFPPNEQTRAVGIFSAFNGAGLALGPFLGGLLITAFNWRWVFWVNIPIIIIGLLCCAFTLKHAPRSTHKIKIDWVGFILLAGGIGGLVYGLINGAQLGWDQTLTRVTLDGGIILLLAFVIVEYKIKNPLLDLSLFNNRHAALATLICIAAGFVTGVFMFFDPLYLELIRQQNAFTIGLTLLCVPLVQILISLFLENLVKKYGVFNLLVLGIGLATLTAICHAFFTPASFILFILIALILMGYTWGIANAGSILATSQSVPERKIGVTLGTIFTFWNVSNTVFLALTSVIFHSRQSTVLEHMLAKINMGLTPDQQQSVDKLITDPQSAHAILSQFSGNNAIDITYAFQTSFMHAFHWISWFSATLLFVFFLIGMKLRK